MNPPMEIKAAGHITLLGIAPGALLVVVRDTQYICRTVKLPIVLVVKRALVLGAAGTRLPPQTL